MANLVGQDIGRYHIIEQLGEGGMAVVYKAYDTHLERDVAIKVIRTGAITPDMLSHMLKRFEREAKSLAKMDHIHIVKMFDYGEYDGSPYLVMQYLPGGTLKKKTGSPMTYQQAAGLLLPIAQALAYAHQRDIIHRDVKPANILITEGGEPMLSDFGVAKILESEQTTQLTGTGVGIGTPEYMAPEQWRGKVLPQTDIYALGVVFYELITGKKPYEADTPAGVFERMLVAPLPRPKSLVPGLPDEVERVLFKALAKQPEDRYENMAALAQALERLHILQPPAVMDWEETTPRRYTQPTQKAPDSVQPPVREIPAAYKKPEEKAREQSGLPRWAWLAGCGGIIVFLFGGIILLGLLLGQGSSGKGPLAMLASVTPTNIVKPTVTAAAAELATATPISLPSEMQAVLPTENTFVADKTGDSMEFVSETIPDGSEFAPGETFTKTWILANNGSTTWTNEYAFVFTVGDPMTDTTVVFLESDVAPGQRVEISVDMTAPWGDGEYKSYWTLRNDKGDFFGFGPDGDLDVWVEIEVKSAVITPSLEAGIGSRRVSEVDGMEMVYVPAGEFEMGFIGVESNEEPVHTVTLDAYWLDRTEVTNAMYAAFLNAQGNQSEGGVMWLDEGDGDELVVQSGGIWQPKTGYSDHPVIEVSWYGARAYCEWAGRRLPTEAEWEKAARGTDGRVYPWGNNFNCRMGNFDDETIIDEYVVSGGAGCDGYDRTAPVGSFENGASPYGALDMAGNVWEWISTLYASYPYVANDGRENPDSDGIRCLRGGSFNNHHNFMRSVYRYSIEPDKTSHSRGFRCVISATIQ